LASCFGQDGTGNPVSREAGFSVVADSLEVRVKSLNYMGDLLLQELERFHDKRGVFERYLRGDLECHHQGAEAAYCAVTRLLHVCNNGEKASVFVGVGQVAERLGLLTTETRLKPLERCLVAGAELVKPKLGEFPLADPGGWEVRIPAAYSVFDQKLRSTMALARVQVEKLIHEVIEGSAEIVNRLPDKNGDDWGSLEVLRSAAEKGWPHYRGRDRSVRRQDGSDLTLKACDVLFCPVYSRSSIIKGWLEGIGAFHG
jgi:hypothetical protein